jgi:hypothetical protein
MAVINPSAPHQMSQASIGGFHQPKEVGSARSDISRPVQPTSKSDSSRQLTQKQNPESYHRGQNIDMFV